MSQFVDTLCLSWPIDLKQIRHKNIILTGNPLRSAILNNSIQTVSFKNIKINKPIIYITGGGLGSHFINNLVCQIIPSLLKSFIIIHQCGESEYNDYAKLKMMTKSLSQQERSNYSLFKHIEAAEVNWILRNASLIIGRSGANTITECLYTHLPALFIPLPHSGADEQRENALMLKNLKVAEVINQNTVSPSVLFDKITDMIQNIKRYKNNFSRQSDKLVSLPASSLIVQEVEALVVK